MKRTYYRHEYTPEQWCTIIDHAASLGCEVSYSQYGTNAIIDSTRVEDCILSKTGKSLDDSAAREFWANYIFAKIDASSDFTRWIVRQAGTPNKEVSIFRTEKGAIMAKERAEYETGTLYEVQRVNIIPQ